MVRIPDSVFLDDVMSVELVRAARALAVGHLRFGCIIWVAQFACFLLVGNHDDASEPTMAIDRGDSTVETPRVAWV